MLLILVLVGELLNLTHKENFPWPKEISFVQCICRLSAKEIERT
jgi:hypothetical protein